VPREFPTLAKYPATVNPRAGEWNNATCVHCHDVHGAQLAASRAAGTPLPIELLWPYPMPDALGLGLDPEERARVRRIAPGSTAEKAGLKAGDEILRLEGQPLVSIADVQWVLQGARDGTTLKAVVQRGGREESLSLTLPVGWRRSGDTSWRQATSVFFRPDLQAGPVSPEDRKALGLAADAIALRVSRLGTSLENAGFRSGDVIVGVGGRRTGIESLSQLLEHVGLNTRPGEKLPIEVRRDGKDLRLEIPLP
jgi:serine protease Do